MLTQLAPIPPIINPVHSYSKSLLRDINALEWMLENDWFEKGITRIGAEQEMCIVDAQTMQPSPINHAILKQMTSCDWVTTELGKHNLETNLRPRTFAKNCLRQMEKEGLRYLKKIKTKAHNLGADIVITGILPTLSRSFVKDKNITDKIRYQELADIYTSQLKGEQVKININGIDELLFSDHSLFLAACNTSFQIHLQVEPSDFAKYYNIAQLLPCL